MAAKLWRADSCTYSAEGQPFRELMLSVCASFILLGENTIPGVAALASRALAVVDAEQAAPLQKPRVGFRNVEALTNRFGDILYISDRDSSASQVMLLAAQLPLFRSG